MQGLSDDLSDQTTTSDNKKIVYTEESENPIVDFITYILAHIMAWGLFLGFPYFVFYLMFWVETHFINIKESLLLRGFSLRDVLEIPPPITEENKDRYLEELSKITEADDWIERHSIENKSNQDVNKTEQQHRDEKTSFKEELPLSVQFLIDVCIVLFFVFGPLLFLPFYW